MQKNKAGTKIEVPTAYHCLIKYNNNKRNLQEKYDMEKVQWNSINKKQNGLK